MEWGFIIVGAISAAIVFSGSTSLADSVAEPTLTDGGSKLCREILKNGEKWSAVKRWLIEYEARPFGDAGKTIIPVHKVMAVAGPGAFYELSAHFPGYPWRMDPYRQEFFIHDGKTCHSWPFNRIFSEDVVKTGDVLPGTIPQDVLLEIIPSWPLTNYKMPIDAGSGTSIIPVEALKSGEYSLLSVSDTVAGERCAVFDRNGIDRIWVAVEKGVCVMRREIRDPRSGGLLQRIMTEKVTQVAPELWLPTEFRNQMFSGVESTNQNIPKLESRIHVLRCELDDNVPDSTFLPTHPAGSLRYDKNGQFTQVSPGGEDLLDDFVNFAVKYGHLPTKPIQRDHSYIWLLGGLATGLCARVFFMPKRKA